MPYLTPEINSLREQVQQLLRRVATLEAHVLAGVNNDKYPPGPIWVAPPTGSPGTANPPAIYSPPTTAPAPIHFPSTLPWQFNEAEWGPPGGPAKFGNMGIKITFDPGVPDNTMIVMSKKPPAPVSSIVTS